jgi:hypothetical protein
MGTTNKIAIERTNARTPPSFLGIERKIAYANKKYHSGWIWAGVTKGFAGIKLSGSPNKYGSVRVSMDRQAIININPIISLKLKYGWNGILSWSPATPRGFLDPVWCKNNKWTSVAADTIKGNKKWIAKNRVKVGLSTANPPQTQFTKVVPK